MPTHIPLHSARESLRQLTCSHALVFGSRLLRRGANGVITFREFLGVAKELVAQAPDQTAVYLAALVALDMGDETVRAEPPPPSAN